MAILYELRKRVWQIVPSVLGASLFGYFVYHAVQGDRGIMAWLVLRQQIEETRATAAEVAAERQTLERRVALLSTRSLDPDMLDERARAVLNLAGSDELVILREAAAPDQSSAD